MGKVEETGPRAVADCETIADVQRLLGENIRRVLSGEITPKEANAITREADKRLKELDG